MKNTELLELLREVREVQQAAFSRGVAAMREAAAQYAKDFCPSGHAQSIRALPDPEDK